MESMTEAEELAYAWDQVEMPIEAIAANVIAWRKEVSIMRDKMLSELDEEIEKYEQVINSDPALENSIMNRIQGMFHAKRIIEDNCVKKEIDDGTIIPCACCEDAKLNERNYCHYCGLKLH